MGRAIIYYLKAYDLFMKGEGNVKNEIYVNELQQSVLISIHMLLEIIIRALSG